MEHELDKEVRRAFDHAAARELPGEPFLSELQRRIAATRPRRQLSRTLVRVLVIASVALASPWLIEGSVVLTHALDFIFARLADFLGTPAGIGLVVLGVAIVVAYRRRRHPRF